MMWNEYRRAMDRLQLSPERDARIRAVLASACPDQQEVMFMKKRKKKLSGLVLAAVVAACLLAGTALAVSRTWIHLAITDKSTLYTNTEQPDETNSTSTPEKYYSIEFEPTESDSAPSFSDLGYWYPEILPDGFEESFVSEQLSGMQRIVWRNENNDCLALVCQIADAHNDITLNGDLHQEDVSIRGVVGTLFVDNAPTETKIYTAVCWTAPEQGVGFFLEYGGSEEIDLLAIAESVRMIEPSEKPIPTLSEDKYKALEELGDYQISPPAGYELYEFTGSCKEQGGGWYAYVRRHWQNEQNHTIHFSYESLVPTLHNSFEDALLQAKSGSASVHWSDPALGLTFYLQADGLSAEAMADLINSITLS